MRGCPSSMTRRDTPARAPGPSRVRSDHRAGAGHRATPVPAVPDDGGRRRGRGWSLRPCSHRADTRTQPRRRTTSGRGAVAARRSCPRVGQTRRRRTLRRDVRRIGGRGHQVVGRRPSRRARRTRPAGIASKPRVECRAAEAGRGRRRDVRSRGGRVSPRGRWSRWTDRGKEAPPRRSRRSARPAGQWTRSVLEHRTAAGPSTFPRRLVLDVRVDRRPGPARDVSERRTSRRRATQGSAGGPVLVGGQ